MEVEGFQTEEKSAVQDEELLRRDKMIESYKKAQAILEFGRVEKNGSLLELQLQGVEGVVWDKKVLGKRIKELRTALMKQGCGFDRQGNLIES
ncbi:MAG: hypothetical protein AB1352_01115 [Patescibacteria group bacterium]